ncbi:MAG: hypothetical protein ABIJ34_07395 [archaeon]
MVEYYITVAGESINYEGLFTMKDLFRIIDKYYRTKGFDKKIVFDEEYTTDKGKYFHLKTHYYKKVDAYIRLTTRLWIYVNDYVVVEKEVEGNKIKTGQGKISITFDASLQTNYFGIYPDTVLFYFLFRLLYEKIFAGGKIKYWDQVSKHVINELKTEISSYLNLNKFLYER